MNALRFLKPMSVAVPILALIVAGFLTRAWWLPAGKDDASEGKDRGKPAAPSERILLSEQAQKNLRVAPRRLEPESFWKTMTLPGVVVDQPGVSDRGVVAPVAGVVKTIHLLPGDVVEPGRTLFTIRILSESLHATQTELFKAAQDIVLAQARKTRLTATGGAVPETLLIETDNQITRLRTAVKAYRQELLNRGLTETQIDKAEAGKFAVDVEVKAPLALDGAVEMQDLKAELGHQVQAGQTLCLLADHRLLAVEGRAFRDEMPLLEKAIREKRPVEVDFLDDAAGTNRTFVVRRVSNTIDPVTKTLSFLVPFENPSHTVERDGKTITLWKYRPGQPVRLHLRTEKLDNVFVLPVDAVAREGGEAYVFRQNGDVFDRKPVHVVHQDRRHVVVADDGSVPAGLFVASAGAAQLNRMVKAQSGTMPRGFHIHPDGSVHFGNH